MEKVFTDEGDFQIVYKVDDFGRLLEKPLYCVMCKKLAFFIVKETNEPLCESCNRNNLEARNKR